MKEPKTKEEKRKQIRNMWLIVLAINVPMSIFSSSFSHLILAIIALFFLIMFRENKLESE